jgi:hypothetical protein
MGANRAYPIPQIKKDSKFKDCQGNIEIEKEEYKVKETKQYKS